MKSNLWVCKKAHGKWKEGEVLYSNTDSMPDIYWEPLFLNTHEGRFFFVGAEY